jgi:predicted PurR-regulated permease PerM
MPDPVVPSSVPSASAGSSVLTIGGIVLAIGALYLGRDIFIPFALAILLSFALAPVVGWLRRLKLPRVAAVIIAVSVAFAGIAGVSLIVGSQLVQLANNLPTYQQTIREKIRSLRASGQGGGIVDRVTTVIQDLSKELSTPEKPAEQAGQGPEGHPASPPIRVTIDQPAAKPLEIIKTIVGPLLAPLATAGIVVIFVIFVLLEREDLRDRFIKLVGPGDLQKSTEALNDAASRVSRYLLMQLVVNVTYGVPIGVGLYFIGVPNAVLWGLLAAVLRFVPYLGPFLAALFPLALAFAVDPGWMMLLWVIGLFLVAELLSNNVVEPWLYGVSTGVSSLAIIIAAIFWTVLWGPVGLFLSTPLTVCIVVIGRYVPQLEFLGVLLGNDPVLAPEERFYQRLLSGNVEEAVDIAETYVDEKSSREFYDQVAIPALRLAENDRQRGTSDVSYRRVVADTALAVVREVEGHVREPAGDRQAEAKVQEEAGASAPQTPILCIAGRTELDRAAAEMVAQVLGERGLSVRVLPPISVSQDAIGQLDLDGVEVVCLSYVHPQPRVFARYVCRRLKRRAPDLRVAVCFWSTPAVSISGELTKQMAADAVVVSLEAAVTQISDWVVPHISAPMQAPAIPDNEQARLTALHSLGFSASKGKHFDEIASRVAEAFGTPIALVSLIDGEHQLWPGAAGLPEKLDATRQAPRDTSICGHVVADESVLVVDDVTKDPRFAENPFLLENGIRFYAGAPLRTSSGFVVGSLCVIDTKPRTFSPKDQKLLQIIADELMAKVEAECGHQVSSILNRVGHTGT